MNKAETSRTKILVVDDEPDITSSCQSYLGRRGYLVNTTASGSDAVLMVKTLCPDLVILDRTIPDMNGKRVLQAIREYDTRVKVIILTGHSLDTEDEKKEFESLGISFYLEKPLNLEQLEKHIRGALGEIPINRNNELNGSIDQTRAKSLQPLAHKMKNILGNLKNECELYLLNKKDGLYKEKTQEELEQLSNEIIADVIATVDRALNEFTHERKS